MKKEWAFALAALVALIIALLFRRRTQSRRLPPPGSGRPVAPVPRKRRTIREVVAAAFRAAEARDWVDYQTISPEESDAIRARTGSTAYDFTGMKRTLVASEVRKILSKHASDPRPVTEADFARLPSLLACPVKQEVVARKGQLDVLRSDVLDAKGKTLIVEEIRRGRKKLVLLSLYRP